MRTGFLKVEMRNARLLKRIVPTLLVLCLLMATAWFGAALRPAEVAAPVPTPAWINVYGLESVLDGKPLPAGAVVEAFDPQGVLCGQVVVGRPGQYGLMPIYGDDPSTPQDEGALPGDLIELRVNSVHAITSPPEVIWRSAGVLLRVEVYSSSDGSYPVLK